MKYILKYSNPSRSFTIEREIELDYTPSVKREDIIKIKEHADFFNIKLVSLRQKDALMDVDFLTLADMKKG